MIEIPHAALGELYPDRGALGTVGVVFVEAAALVAHDEHDAVGAGLEGEVDLAVVVVVGVPNGV